VEIIFVPSGQDADRGQIEMTATGPWLETILWEIPLMALLSETYFLAVDPAWKKENQEGVAIDGLCECN
jgi:nicotinate phosphoribosyltransferase